MDTDTVHPLFLRFSGFACLICQYEYPCISLGCFLSQSLRQVVLEVLVMLVWRYHCHSTKAAISLHWEKMYEKGIHSPNTLITSQGQRLINM